MFLVFVATYHGANKVWQTHPTTQNIITCVKKSLFSSLS